MIIAAGLEQIRAVRILDATIGNAPENYVPALMARLQTVLGKGEYLDCLPVASGQGLIAAAWGIAVPIFSRAGTRI
jgi:hypothetical protein